MTLIVASPRWRRAAMGANSEIFAVGVGVFSSSTRVATRATVISTATPKNGSRQLTDPSSPPTRGPRAIPTPRAVS